MKAKDVVHLYLGCKILYDFVDNSKSGVGVLHSIDRDGFLTIHIYGASVGKLVRETKLVLRPLSAMTDEEKVEFKKLVPWIDLIEFVGSSSYRYNEHEMIDKHETRVIAVTTSNIASLPLICVPYLLSKGFDLFDLHRQKECLYESDLTNG